MPKEELRNRLGMGSRDFNAALVRLTYDGVIEEADAFAKLPSHVPDLSDISAATGGRIPGSTGLQSILTPYRRAGGS